MTMVATAAQWVSMVVVSMVGNLVAVIIVGNLSDANIPVGSLVAVSTVGNLSVVNIPVGSLVAANIPAGSTVAASIVNVAAMVGIATERERQRCAPCYKISGTVDAGEPLSPGQQAVTDQLAAPDRTLARPDAERLGNLGGAEAPGYLHWATCFEGRPAIGAAVPLTDAPSQLVFRGRE